MCTEVRQVGGYVLFVVLTLKGFGFLSGCVSVVIYIVDVRSSTVNFICRN
jgi:hypothetical protein